MNYRHWPTPWIPFPETAQHLQQPGPDFYVLSSLSLIRPLLHVPMPAASAIRRHCGETVGKMSIYGAVTRPFLSLYFNKLSSMKSSEERDIIKERIICADGVGTFSPAL